MSQGNLAAAIGLANTNKIPPIGAYVQSAFPPGPEASGPYIGCSGSNTSFPSGACYYATNVLGEDVAVAGGITVPADSGVAAGKLGQWVTTGGAPMTVAADGLCSVSATGAVTATATMAKIKCYFLAGTVVPAGKFLWVYGV